MSGGEGRVVQYFYPIVLLAVAGFLFGGVYATWKTAKLVSIVFGIVAVAAAAGGIAWLL